MAAREFPRRPVNHRLLEHTIEQARGWLESCYHDHPDLPEVAKYTPKRLLQISRSFDGSSCVSIVDGSPPVAYAALSYKWGGTHEPALTRSRLKAAAASSLQFDLETLPKTIADAIKVTQAFEINHLWVDALCIVQDDDEDKAREVGQMSLIYSQATVTILASRSNSASDGFLHCRHGKECHGKAERSYPTKWDFRLPYRTQSGEQGSIIMTEPNPGDVEPLDTRAWAFQELMLSPHIISYGTMRTVFDCLSVIPSLQKHFIKFSDDGDKRARESYASIAIRRNVHTVLYAPFEDQRGDDYSWQMAKKAWEGVIGNGQTHGAISMRPHSPTMGLWERLLTSYTRRELTIPQDRLNGFAAVAEAFAKYSNDQYVAGFWRTDLLATLVWAREWPYEQHPPKRPTKYCGPTWSWASIAGTICSITNCFYEVIRWDRKLSILDCQATLVNEATKFGAVSSGFLKLSGRVVRGTISMCRCCAVKTGPPAHNPYLVDVDWPTQYNAENNSKWEVADRYYPDAMEQEFLEGKPIPVVLLVIGYRHGLRESPDRQSFIPEHRNPACCYLVLREVSAGLYTRLGLLKVSCLEPHGYNDVPLCGICIHDNLWDQDFFPVETLTVI